MIRIPYKDIIEKIVEKTGTAKSEIEVKIKEKKDKLSGLITDQGAAQILASEMGVNIYEEYSKPLKIAKIVAGLRNLKTSGKVVQKYEKRNFTTKDGREGKVASFMIGDETGRIRIVLWNDLADLIDELQEGDIVSLENAMSKQNQNYVEIQLFSKENMKINPAGITIEAVKERSTTGNYPKPLRMKISEINDNLDNVEILGNIVAVYDPKFFEVCPLCGKRTRDDNGNYVCPTHNKIVPVDSYVANVTIDDGTGSIRTAFFKNQLNHLVAGAGKPMEHYKTNPGDFQEVKDMLLGEFIKVVGKAIKSEAFDRIEFRSQLVFLKPNPEEELKN